MDITLERILGCIGPGHGSAKALADALGIHPQIITNWKCGPSKSYRKYLPQIAAYFGVSVDYLLGKSDVKTEKPPVSDEELLDEALIQRLCSLSPEEMQKVDAFVQGLIANR